MVPTSIRCSSIFSEDGNCVRLYFSFVQSSNAIKEHTQLHLSMVTTNTTLGPLGVNQKLLCFCFFEKLVFLLNAVSLSDAIAPATVNRK